jgi:rhamnosyltransferase subunit B
MATVLFAYEFGAGLGHVNRLIAIARRLPTGLTPVFAVPGMRFAESAIRPVLGQGAEIRQGVSWPAPQDPEARRVPTHTFADVMRLFGYQETEPLRRRTMQWRSILAEVSPRLIVADFAPTLRLASAQRVPSVVIGRGYTIPPARRVLPSMRPWNAAVPARSRAHEGMLLQAANEVRDALKGPAVDYFADVFHGEASFPCTIAELDPYARERDGDVLWPFNVPQIRMSKEGEASNAPTVFCYLSADHPGLGPTLKALSALDARSEVYVSGVDPRVVASRCSPRVGVRMRPAPFDEVLPGAKLLIQHGGLGSSSAGLLAGVPQLVLSYNLEQGVNGYCLEQLGVAKCIPVPPAPDVDALGSVIRGMLGDRDLAARARVVAQDVEARRTDDSVGQVLSACARYL